MYEAWRITFQSSEHAARAAFAEVEALREALAGAVNVLDLLRTYAGAKYDHASSRAGTLVHVATTIDAARALLPPNAALSRRGAGQTEEPSEVPRSA